MLAWVFLVVSGVLEAVWATALGKSAGFTKLIPSIVFGVSMTASMAGLALAMREIPTSTAYAIWVGIGASPTVIVAMISGDEPVNVIKIVLILVLVACVVGLKLVSDAGH